MLNLTTNYLFINNTLTTALLKLNSFNEFATGQMLWQGEETGLAFPIDIHPLKGQHTHIELQAWPRHPELRALLFKNSVMGSFTSPSNWYVGWRRLGQRLNVTAQWQDHLNWYKVLNTASMILPVILRPWLVVRPGLMEAGCMGFHFWQIKFDTLR